MATQATISNQASSAHASLPAPPPLQQVQLTAETQAAPLVAQLKSDPNNAALLENIGDIYYDAQQYPTAIEYYQRALKVQPSNTSVGDGHGNGTHSANIHGPLHELPGQG